MFRLAYITALFSIALVPSPAHANAGVPMLALAWPAQWLALVPIIALECELSRRTLQLSFRQLLWPITKANLLSTAVGVPIAWFVMLVPLTAVGFGLSLFPNSTEIPRHVEYLLLPLTAAWVGGSSSWEIYFAFVVLTIPFCAISAFLENVVVRRSFPDLNRSAIRSVIVRANVWSYALLSALALVFPLLA